MSAREPQSDAVPGRQVCACQPAWAGDHGYLVLLLSLPVLLLLARLGVELQPLSRHMAQHIAIMNVAAPFLALAIQRPAWIAAVNGTSLLLATLAQLALLFGWHAPAMVSAAHVSPVLHAGMQATLFAVAIWFWTAVVAQVRAARWRSLVALLVTGKLFCLLGAVLALAPRDLYQLAADHPAGHGASSLADQQLAGLMMLAACPLTYVLAGVMIAARWLDEVSVEER